MARTVSTTAALTILLLTFASCSRPSHDDPVRARDDVGFQAWIDARTEVLSPAEVRELNDARQMIRFRTMQAHPGMISGDFANAVYAEIDGRTLHDLLLTSCALQIDRVRVELENYRPLVERFQRYRADRSLDDDQKKDVEDKLANLNRLVREHREELDRLTKRLTELKQSDSAKEP